MTAPILNLFQQITLQNTKGFALLIDPDQADKAFLEHTMHLVSQGGVSFIFIGGSLVSGDSFLQTIRYVKARTHLPVIIFPGSNHHIFADADGILLLSLISGRNPEFLIGQHVVAAPLLKRSGLEILPTGYILVDGGAPTTVSYVSNTHPLPADKPAIAAATALAGEMLGQKLIYLDAGSGARAHIQPRMVAAVRKEVSLPIIVGGGITNVSDAYAMWGAGADVVVVGNATEKSPDFIAEMGRAVQDFNSFSGFQN